MCGGNLSIARSKAMQSSGASPTGWSGQSDHLTSAGGVVPGLGAPCDWPLVNHTQVQAAGNWGTDGRFDGLLGINPGAQQLPGSLEAALSGLSGLRGLRTQLPFMAMPPPRQPSIHAPPAPQMMRLGGMPMLQEACTSANMSCDMWLARPMQAPVLAPSSLAGLMRTQMPGVRPCETQWSGSPNADHDMLSSWSSQDPSEVLHLSPNGCTTAAAPAPAERPPTGCDPNAIKLFVGNIPKSLPEGQLHQLLSLVGKVVHLETKRARFTHIAFVWYATREHAEQAILHFKAMRHVLPGLTEGQERPLVVRRAKLRPAKVPLHKQADVAAAAASGGYASLDLELLEAPTLGGQGACEGEDAFAWGDSMNSSVHGSCSGAPSRALSDVLACGVGASLGQARRCFSQDLQHQHHTLALFGTQGRTTASCLFDPSRPLAPIGSKPASTSTPAAAVDPNAEVVVSMPLTPLQLGSVSSHVRQMVATVSGAHVVVLPATRDQPAQVHIRGTAKQCNTAQGMVSSMIG